MVRIFAKKTRSRSVGPGDVRPVNGTEFRIGWNVPACLTIPVVLLVVFGAGTQLENDEDVSDHGEGDRHEYPQVMKIETKFLISRINPALILAVSFDQESKEIQRRYMCTYPSTSPNIKAALALSVPGENDS